MAFDALPPELAEHLAAICAAQLSGRLEPQMPYAPGKGLRGVSRLGDDAGQETMIREDITRDQLRALEGRGYLSLATPRSQWSVTATAKALTEYDKSSN